jgi:group I intron endonuclease
VFIYKITNKINGKVYVGQTTWTVQKRWYCHCRKTGYYSVLNNAICKYGKENFNIETIEICSSLEQLNEREKYWINFYDCISPKGYNMETGGLNKLASEETKQKQRLAKLGKKYDKRKEGSGDNISLAKVGKNFEVKKLDGTFVGKWFNKSECARQLDLCIDKISACCLGKRKQHKGYTFTYIEEVNG